MSEQKMREEFEARFPVPFGVEWRDGDYQISNPNAKRKQITLAGHLFYLGRWESWQASREALEQSTVSPEVQAMLSFFEADEAEEIRMAEAYIRESERCSISALQRKFKIGYNRACRLMDRLVALKVVSPIDAEGRRTVLPEQVKQ